MIDNKEYRARAVTVLTGIALGLAAPLALGVSAAHAGAADRDGDGMPNRWEVRHGLSPRLANAGGDRDLDGLTNLREFRLRIHPVDEDSDDDGHDDRDEVSDGLRSTHVDDRDTDNDAVLDGDEDADHDRLDNEDEDDAREACRLDDDDRDDDHVDDEDENELRLRAADSDSDDDGVEDGEEDRDEDGESNEDEDDDLSDRCGRSNLGEDDGDVLGTIATYDSQTWTLTIDTRALGTLSFRVTEDTEVEVEGADEEGSTADLTPGTAVEEVEIDDETGALESIELYGSAGQDPDEV